MKKNIIEEQTINDNNYQKLKELFPNAVSVDEDGKYVIDPQKLQMSLDPSKAKIQENGYGLNWVGKKEAYYNAFTKNYKVLKPLKDDSKNWDDTENILIKGDNLDALKILRHNYFEAIKMIYIDPPYNTKNDGFVYNDNFTSSTEQTLEELGYDKEYIDYIENIQGAKTHSGWLSFMYPRLLLAKDLLKDDGVIFISIDDNEVAQLKILCDEVFGEDNFIAQTIRASNSTKNNSNYLSVTHDYTLIYAKVKDNIEKNWQVKKRNVQDFQKIVNRMIKNKLSNEEIESELRALTKYPKYYDFDHYYYCDAKGVYRTDNSGGVDNGNFETEILHPITKKSCKKPAKGWRYNEATIKNMLKEDKFYFGKDETTIPLPKRYLQDYLTIVPSAISFFDTQIDTNLFKKIKIPFDFPKPYDYIIYLLEMINTKNEIILDFFAGSGTTAHAVMDLNAKDGGNRKYICVQWAEETPQKSEARKAGYETIFDITKARIDKAGDKIAKGDIGFRTFEIVFDQKQCIYQKELGSVTQEDLFKCMNTPHIKTNEEILYNLFIAEAMPLSTKYEELIKDKLYLASNVAFVLGNITSNELVAALKNKKECEYITVYSPNVSYDNFTLEVESNLSKLGIKPNKLRFRG